MIIIKGLKGIKQRNKEINLWVWQHHRQDI